MRLIGVGGEPATGKSEIIKALIPEKAVDAQEAGIKCMWDSESGIIALGRYDAKARFPGTDGLSMAIQPKVLTWLETMNKQLAGDWLTILFEGDRLFNAKFLEQTFLMDGLKCHFFILTASDYEKKRRHGARKDTQRETWLKGRQTKYHRLEEKYGIIILKNETPTDQRQNITRLKELIYGKTVVQQPTMER